MTLYAKIDRDSGALIKKKEYNNTNFSTQHQHLWVPVEVESTPEYNERTQRLVRHKRAAPLPADETTKWLEGFIVENKTAEELVKEQDAIAKLATMGVLKGLVLALSDGSFVPGSNMTVSQIQEVIREKL